MTRQKSTSRILKKAELRTSGLKAIDRNMDFGDTCNLQNMTQLIEELRTKIDAYNTALVMIDSSKTEITELEKNLGELSEKMLIGVAFKYGKDSREYEMAGGVRKSERVRRSSVNRLKAAGVEQTSTQKSQTA
jgi:HAMP domain-containing protein